MRSRNGYRLPGYPFYLSLFYKVSDPPLLFARYGQIVLSSLIIMSGYFSLLNILCSYKKSLIGTLIISLWYPFYYFSPVLCPESCSIFLLSILFLLLTILNADGDSPLLYILPLILGLLVYLKPNHVLLLIPVLIFLFYRFKFSAIRHTDFLLSLLVILMLPWLMFLYSVNKTIIPLSTTSGINLYLGTGIETDPFDLTSEGTIHVRTADQLMLRDEEEIKKTQRETFDMTAVEKNRYFSDKARKIWALKPMETAVFGLSKILHGFGFSLRNIHDMISALFCIVTFVCSIWLWYSERHRAWSVFYWALVFVLCLQMFFFLPNQRFKIAIFDFPSLTLILLCMFSLFDPFIKKTSFMETKINAVRS